MISIHYESNHSYVKGNVTFISDINYIKMIIKKQNNKIILSYIWHIICELKNDLYTKEKNKDSQGKECVVRGFSKQ